MPPTTALLRASSPTMHLPRTRFLPKIPLSVHTDSSSLLLLSSEGGRK